GRDADVEAAVAVEHRRTLAVAGEPLPVDDEHRDPRTVLRREPHLPGLESLGVAGDPGPPAELRRARREVGAIGGARQRGGGKVEEELAAIEAAVDPAHRARAREREQALVLAVQ